MISTVLRYSVVFLALMPMTITVSYAQQPSEKNDQQKAVPAGPPVGFVVAEKTLLVDRTELNGRIEAVNQVTLTARLNAFLESQHVKDGAVVKKDDLLFKLEQGPFKAEVEVRKAAVEQAQAQLDNANLTLKRAKELLERKSGSQSTADSARASQRSAAAQLASAKAQLDASMINFGYTEIRSPIDGVIGRAQVKPGNLVVPGTALTSIVSQDPMNIVFPISVKAYQEIRERAAKSGRSFPSKVRILLSNGEMYSHEGNLDFIDNSVSLTTDTIMMRGKISNPIIPASEGGNGQERYLVNNEYVTVFVESTEGEPAIKVPASAVMTTKQGNSVVVITNDNKLKITPVQLRQMRGLDAIIMSGLEAGEKIAIEGFQYLAEPNMTITPLDKSKPKAQSEK